MALGGAGPVMETPGETTPRAVTTGGKQGHTLGSERVDSADVQLEMSDARDIRTVDCTEQKTAGHGIQPPSDTYDQCTRPRGDVEGTCGWPVFSFLGVTKDRFNRLAAVARPHAGSVLGRHVECLTEMCRFEDNGCHPDGSKRTGRFVCSLGLKGVRRAEDR